MNANEKRDVRENALARAWRGGKGRKRTGVLDRTPLSYVHFQPAQDTLNITEHGYAQITKTRDGAKASLHGYGIVVKPAMFTKADRKAFRHFCEKTEIALVPCETVEVLPPGVNPAELNPFTSYSAFVAYGSPDALRSLVMHKYVLKGTWFYATNYRSGAKMNTLAIAKRKGKNDRVPASVLEMQQEHAELRDMLAAYEPAYKLADAWLMPLIAEIESEHNCKVDPDGLNEMREMAAEWFMHNQEAPPESLEELAAWGESNVEWDKDRPEKEDAE